MLLKGIEDHKEIVLVSPNGGVFELNGVRDCANDPVVLFDIAPPGGAATGQKVVVVDVSQQTPAQAVMTVAKIMGDVRKEQPLPLPRRGRLDEKS